MPVAADPAVKARALALYRDQVPVNSIAALAGCSKAAVAKWAGEAGLPMRGRLRLADLDRSMVGPHDAHVRCAIVAAYRGNGKLDDISETYGESVRQIIYIVRRAGVAARVPQVRLPLAPGSNLPAGLPEDQATYYRKVRSILGAAAARAAFGLAAAAGSAP